MRKWPRRASQCWFCGKDRSYVVWSNRLITSAMVKLPKYACDDRSCIEFIEQYFYCKMEPLVIFRFGGEGAIALECAFIQLARLQSAYSS